MGDEAIRPGWGWYVLAAVMAAAGLALPVLGVVQFAGSFRGLGRGLTQVVVPGTRSLELSEPGTYRIYHEWRSVVGGRTYSNAEDLGGLVVSVTEQESGREVPLAGCPMRETYTLGGRSGVGMWQFEVSRPGRYELSAAYQDGREGPQVVLAVGRPVLGGVGRRALAMGGGICAFVVLGGGALAIFLVTLVRRRSALAARKAGTAPPTVPPSMPPSAPPAAPAPPADTAAR